MRGLLSPPSHSRLALLGTLAPSAPCFGRFRCVKNNTQLFLTCYPVLEEIKTKANFGCSKASVFRGFCFYPSSNRGRQSAALPYRAKNMPPAYFFNALTVLKEIISTFGRNFKKHFASASAFCYLLENNYDCPSGKLWVMIGCAKLWCPSGS